MINLHNVYPHTVETIAFPAEAKEALIFILKLQNRDENKLTLLVLPYFSETPN